MFLILHHESVSEIFCIMCFISTLNVKCGDINQWKYSNSVTKGYRKRRWDYLLLVRVKCYFVFAYRDIYLLDDPLSAVDVHVSADIFNSCILQALKHKTVILVTHQVQVYSCLTSYSQVFSLHLLRKVMSSHLPHSDMLTHFFPLKYGCVSVRVLAHACVCVNACVYMRV